MKKLITTIVLLNLIALQSCNIVKDAPPQKAEVLVLSGSGSSIGSMITVNITANGGTGNIAAIGAKVSVPAGAMAVGSQLSIQQISNVITPEEKSIRINGDWTKPISIDYLVNDGEPDNYNVFVKNYAGYWIGARQLKISGNTISVRLGANSGSTVKNARPMGKTYDLIFAKVFTVKPEVLTLDLGKSQKFTAYAKEGFVPRKAVDGSEITSKEQMDEYLKKIDEIDQPTYAEDDVVPLAPLNSAKDDDEIMPLPVYAKEYPFENTKAGYSRSWTVDKVGTIKSNGNYTAPNDNASRGKISIIKFSSKNEKTGKTITAKAKVRIKDDFKRYIGTITSEEEYITIYSKYETIKKIILKTDVILTSNRSGVPYLYASTTDRNNGGDPDSQYNTKSSLILYEDYDTDGKRKRSLDGGCTAEGKFTGSIRLDFDKEYKTYKINGWIGGENLNCSGPYYAEQSFPKSGTWNTSVFGITFSNSDQDFNNVSNLKSLKGNFSKVLNATSTSKTAIKISWDLNLQE